MEKDGKKLWRLRKQLNDEGSSYSKITLIQDDTLLHGEKAANLFADTYQQAQTSNIQITTQKHRETRSQLRIIGEPDDIPPMMDSPIVYKELTSALAKLKLKKSPGPDCITNEMIINLRKPALHKLLEIYNKSWEEGSLPQSCTEATMIPIHKPGKDKTEPQVTDPLA